jgi:hypothetical protein
VLASQFVEEVELGPLLNDIDPCAVVAVTRMPWGILFEDARLHFDLSGLLDSENFPVSAGDSMGSIGIWREGIGRSNKGPVTAYTPPTPD